jgi:putative molybdopterin biosynthesis protein
MHAGIPYIPVMATRLGNGLGAERSRRGWTQAQAAEAASITRQSYAAIEAGSSVPSTEVALRLARAFGRSVEALFRLPEEPAERVRARWAGAGAPAGQRVRLVRVAGASVAYPVGAGERPLQPADGVVCGEEDGEVVVELLSERPPEAALAVVGCDPAFGIVAEALRRERGLEVAWQPRGSRAALETLARGEAHVAGAHLLDPVTGEPNERWVREIVPFPCTRIAFAEWEQALLLRPGNPAGIGGVADLARPGVRLLNREAGSGSRMLLDERLAAAGIPTAEVAGYGTAARGHLAVGEAIAAGLADAGVGIRAAGALFGLASIPLRTERYELIVPDHLLDLPAVGALLDLLGRPGIRAQVEALPGYDAASMGTPS